MRLQTALIMPFMCVASACGSIMDLDMDFGCLLCGDFGPWMDIPIESQILRGDTLRVRAFGSSTDNRGSWRLSNDVAAFENAVGSRSPAAGPTDHVLVRGLRLGNTVLTFLPVSDTTLKSTATLSVRDSTEVADIEFWMSSQPDTLRLKVGEPIQLTISLVDDQRRVIHGWPESVTAGDTLVLRRQQFALPPRPGDHAYQAAKAGTTQIVATFRELRRVLVVIVSS
jgi:hypothetical protein